MTNEAFDHITREKLKDYAAAIPAGLWEKIHVPAINAPQDPFDQFFKEKLQEITAPVSPELWNRIRPEEEKRRRIFFLPRKTSMMAASLLMLFIAGTVSAYIYFQQVRRSRNAEINATQTNQPNNNGTGTAGSATPGQNNTGPGNSSNPGTPAGAAASPVTTDAVDAGSSSTEQFSRENTRSSSGAADASANTVVFGKHRIGKIFRQQGTGTEASSTGNFTDSRDEDMFYAPSSRSNAALIPLQRKGHFASGERVVAYNNHAGSIKNIIICPSDKNLRNTDWDLEVFASPDLSFKTVSSNTASQQFMSRKDSSESARVGFTAGFRIVKPLNEHFLIKAGLQYAQINEHFTYKTADEIKTTTVITVRNITLANGTVVTVSDTSVLQQAVNKYNTVNNRYKSIDVPVLLGYQFGNDDLKIGINAGVVVNLNSSYKGVMLDSTLSPQPIDKNSSVGYKTNIGVGLYAGFNISKRINYNTSVFAEPYLRYNLSDITTPQSVYKQRFSVGGLSLGLRFNLNKH
ncbi:MAG TPA: outer membrane beta-barrel protein [Sediminibacterium sp.]|nr:outer membrane beta-barrel protein [Sediminibacterium sp.]